MKFLPRPLIILSHSTDQRPQVRNNATFVLQKSTDDGVSFRIGEAGDR